MRLEKDSLGSLSIPLDAEYGIQSFRAAQNFRISGTSVHPELIRCLLLVKKAAAVANLSTGVLDEIKAQAIVHATDELLDEFFKELFDELQAFDSKKQFTSHFIIDAYQAGAGTSQNMNANEVIANRANLHLGHPLGSYHPIHPNDHVNASQSTNDVYPTAMRLAALQLSRGFVAELQALGDCFKRKALEFDGILKAARTHLQDAVPMRVGQEWSAYAETLFRLRRLVESAQESLCELGLGGSAAGTGINVPEGFQKAALKELSVYLHEPRLKSAPNLFEAMQSQLPVMIYSQALRATALELTRILNDLRLLGSGPSTGFSELVLPSVQPGSSIMPGKVNPSMLEMGNQVCFKVIGNDAAMAFALQAGQLELNVMMPVMAQLILESTQILTNALRAIRERCIEGIEVNRERCTQYLESTSQIATALNPVLGYEKSAELAKEAVKTGKTVFSLVREKNLLTEAQLKMISDPKKLTGR